MFATFADFPTFDRDLFAPSPFAYYSRPRRCAAYHCAPQAHYYPSLLTRYEPEPETAVVDLSRLARALVGLVASAEHSQQTRAEKAALPRQTQQNQLQTQSQKRLQGHNNTPQQFAAENSSSPKQAKQAVTKHSSISLTHPASLLRFAALSTHELPGLVELRFGVGSARAEDIRVQVRGRSLHVSCTLDTSSFERCMTLPRGCDLTGVTAAVEDDGVLVVRVPTAKAARAVPVPVQVDDRDRPASLPSPSAQDDQPEQPEPLGLDETAPAPETVEAAAAPTAERQASPAPSVLLTVEDDQEQERSGNWETASAGSQQAAM